MALSKPTSTAVVNLTGTTQDSSVVSALIDDAALMAEDCLAGYDDARQEAALKWFAAHLLANTSDDRSQVLSSQKLGSASETYARGALGNGLNSTPYGQQAIAIAPCLGRIGRPKASIQTV